MKRPAKAKRKSKRAGQALDSKSLPKYQREPRRVSFQFTDRDVEILRALNRYRYLRTGQIHQLLFSDNGTVQSARRRLRNLYHHGYIARAQPYVQVGKPLPEIAYYIDRKGRKVLREHGENPYIWRKGGEVKYHFLEHAIALSEFRIHFEKAVARLPDVELELFIPDFQMREAAEQYAGRKRYLLFREAFHPVHRKNFVVHPDALIVLSLSVGGVKQQLMLCLEIDRGTEGLERIRDKLTGYHLAKEQRLFRQFGDISNFFVLFQAPSEKRSDSIFHALVDHIGATLARVTSAGEVTQDSVLTGTIWRDPEGNRKAIFRNM